MMRFPMHQVALLAANVITLLSGIASSTPLWGLPSAGDLLDELESLGSTSCCQQLTAALGDKVSYPISITFIESQASYWSQQEALLIPSCILRPKSTSDVASAISILSLSQNANCEFAIKGAGHTPWAGAANINSGVTIDLTSMAAITVNAAHTVTSIGPGARWVDVYNTLDPLNLMVSGGRVADVGVGGLITGGGFSFFGPRYGFVCDSVVNYEIVLAGGRVVDVNATSHPDLFFALKGGSNNFGVVTRFDLKTFSQGLFWGGFIYYNISTKDEQFQAFAELAGSPNYDPYAALINSYTYTGLTGWTIENCLEYTKPQAYPPFFASFTNIQPQLLSTMRIDPIASFAEELAVGTPAGSRQLFATATYGNSAALLSDFFALADSTLQPIKSVLGLRYSLSYQPVPTALTSKSAATGGNPLGVTAADGPLVLVLISVSWLEASDDAAVTAQAQSLFEQGNALARQRGLLNDWIYLNYAASWQDPIGGYNGSNVEKLMEASRTYDPSGVFQKQVPGGFKLFTKN